MATAIADLTDEEMDGEVHSRTFDTPEECKTFRSKVRREADKHGVKSKVRQVDPTTLEFYFYLPGTEEEDVAAQQQAQARAREQVQQRRAIGPPSAPKPPPGAGKPPPGPGGAGGGKPTPGKTDYRSALIDLLQTMSLAGGLAPITKVRAQAMAINVHTAELATGLNALAASSKVVDSGLKWVCGKDGDGTGGNLGLIVGLVSLAPFAATSYQIWSPPPKKIKNEHNQLVDNPAYGEWKSQLQHFADLAEQNSKNFMEETLRQFQEAAAAEEEATRQAQAAANGHGQYPQGGAV